MSCVLDGGRCNGMCSDCPERTLDEMASERLFELDDAIEDAERAHDWDTHTRLVYERQEILDGR